MIDTLVIIEKSSIGDRAIGEGLLWGNLERLLAVGGYPNVQVAVIDLDNGNFRTEVLKGIDNDPTNLQFINTVVFLDVTTPLVTQFNLLRMMNTDFRNLPSELLMVGVLVTNPAYAGMRELFVDSMLPIMQANAASMDLLFVASSHGVHSLHNDQWDLKNTEIVPLSYEAYGETTRTARNLRPQLVESESDLQQTIRVGILGPFDEGDSTLEAVSLINAVNELDSSIKGEFKMTTTLLAEEADGFEKGDAFKDNLEVVVLEKATLWADVRDRVDVVLDMSSVDDIPVNALHCHQNYVPVIAGSHNVVFQTDGLSRNARKFPNPLYADGGVEFLEAKNLLPITPENAHLLHMSLHQEVYNALTGLAVLFLNKVQYLIEQKERGATFTPVENTAGPKAMADMLRRIEIFKVQRGL